MGDLFRFERIAQPVPAAAASTTRASSLQHPGYLRWSLKSPLRDRGPIAPVWATVVGIVVGVPGSLRR
jgi:hypothetical protein